MTGEKLTYSQIIEQSVAIAAALKGKGIKSGDVVGVLSENCLEYVTVILGILAAGATCFPLNPLYTTSKSSLQTLNTKLCRFFWNFIPDFIIIFFQAYLIFFLKSVNKKKSNNKVNE